MSDLKKISGNKLGFGYLAPVTPMIPTGAQVQAASGYLHLQFGSEASEGAYISLTLRGTFAPSRSKEIMAAIMAQPEEASYSGTGSVYRRLTIKAIEGKDDRVDLFAGDVRICSIFVDASMELTSGDEPVQLH